jgi:hypothetical protein
MDERRYATGIKRKREVEMSQMGSENVAAGEGIKEE